MARSRVATLFALLSSCGASTQLELNDPPRADVMTVTPDATMDAAQPARCVVGPLRTIASGMPHFLYSLTPLAPGRPGFAVAYASGFGDLSPTAMRLLDEELAPGASLTLGMGEWRVSRAGNDSLLLSWRNEGLARGRWVIAGDGELRFALSEVELSGMVGHTAVGSAPAKIGELIALATRDRSGAQGFIRLERDTLSNVGASTHVARTDAHVFARAGGWSVLARAGAAVSVRQYTRGAEDSGGFEVALDLAEHPIVATADESERLHVLHVATVGAGFALRETRIDGAGAVNTRAIGDTNASYAGPSIAVQRGLVAVAWAEPVRAGVGAQVRMAVVDDARSALEMEPITVGQATGNSASYTMHTAVAPHPRGFVIAFSGWQRTGTYGVFAAIVQCPLR